jgi:hypothetical protein
LQDPIPVAAYRLFDIGVADVNQDGQLDVFTTAHSAMQSVLISQGDGFADITDSMGLNQSLEFPGLEDTGLIVPSCSPGLHVFWGQNLLQIVATDLSASLVGNLTASSRVVVVDSQGMAVERKLIHQDPLIDGTHIEFATDASGSLSLRSSIQATDITIELNDDFPLDRVFVGSGGLHPSSHTFDVTLLDRHGEAWADYNGDGIMDVLFVRGGLRGRIESVEGDYRDQLLRGGDDGFTNVTVDAGLYKNDCSARQVWWMDINRDGLLDVYIGCNASPNELFIQGDGGTFSEAAAEYGLDIHDTGLFRWADIDGDGRDDMLYVSKQDIVAYYNEPGAFRRVEVGTNPGSNVNQILPWDYDLDGDADFFVAASDSSLLINDGGVLERRDAKDFGLPNRSTSAAWVDYDGDGLADLHSLPGGIYLHNLDGTFQSTGLLDETALFGGVKADAKITWFDADGDGDRDLLVAAKLNQAGLEAEGTDDDEADQDALWRVKFVENDRTPGNWLNVDLHGPTMNHQAIGATVTVTAGGQDYVQEVGFSETSHYSQGHYWLYFTMPVGKDIESVTVRWPDGSTRTLTDVATGQMITIDYGAQ